MEEVPSHNSRSNLANPTERVLLEKSSVKAASLKRVMIRRLCHFALIIVKFLESSLKELYHANQRLQLSKALSADLYAT